MIVICGKVVCLGIKDLNVLGVGVNLGVEVFNDGL